MAGIKRAAVPHQADLGTSRLREAADGRGRQLNTTPLMGGMVVSFTIANGTERAIPHGLGYEPRHVIIMNLNSSNGASVSRVPRVTAKNKRTVTVANDDSRTLIINMWVGP